MNRISKSFAVFTILIITISSPSLLTVKPATAQSIPKPAVPQFSIQVVDHSYDVPPTNTIDPYSGKQIINPGYHVNDIKVEGKIKNQPFTPYGNIDFYYNISYRGHFAGEWRKLFGSEDVDFLKQSYGSEYTSFNISRYNAIELHEGDQIDVRIEAIIGSETWGFASAWPYRILNGEVSGWSDTLTVTVSTDITSTNTYATTIDGTTYPTLTTPPAVSTPTPSPATSEPTPTPSVPEFSWLMILPLFLSILSIAVLIRTRKFDDGFD